MLNNYEVRIVKCKWSHGVLNTVINWGSAKIEISQRGPWPKKGETAEVGGVVVREGK